MTHDPVCGMEVDPAGPERGSLQYRGKTCFFCSPACRDKFRADPEEFLGPEPPNLPATIYVCPMHPEIVRDRPGPCPICGMALEPCTLTLDEEENPELRDRERTRS